MPGRGTMAAVSRPITEATVAASADRLRRAVGVFTRAQLYYAVCATADVPTASPVPGLSGCALLLLVLASLGHGVAATVLAFLGIMAVTAAVASALSRRSRPTVPNLGVGTADFERILIAMTPEPAGLIDAAAPLVSNQNVTTTVVCDRVDTATLVQALAQRRGWDISVSVGVPGDTSCVACLHDCDPQGCALPERLRESGGADIVDLALHPDQVVAWRLPVHQGAPARVDASLARLLGTDGVAWLAAGRRAELAAIEPRTLIELIESALTSTAARRES